jgi:hypothetical protein
MMRARAWKEPADVIAAQRRRISIRAGEGSEPLRQAAANRIKFLSGR